MTNGKIWSYVLERTIIPVLYNTLSILNFPLVCYEQRASEAMSIVHSSKNHSTKLKQTMSDS